jgi:hypothetical protein
MNWEGNDSYLSRKNTAQGHIAYGIQRHRQLSNRGHPVH